MDVSKLSLEEFLNETIFSEVDPVRDAFVGDFHELASIYHSHVGATIRQLDESYALARLGNDLSDVALTFEGQIAGLYHGNVLILDAAHQGKSLSTPLILEAAKARPDPNPRMLSDAGRAALTRAWQVAHDQVANPWP
jgi:hypothetical protein